MLKRLAIITVVAGLAITAAPAARAQGNPAEQRDAPAAQAAGAPSAATGNEIQLVPLAPAGSVIVPASSVPQRVSLGGELAVALSGVTGTTPEEVRTANTNYAIFKPAVTVEPAAPGQLTSTTLFPETPASIACIYGLTPRIDGCNPNYAKATPTGGSKVIVIVDAFDTPDIKTNAAFFSQHFNLPPIDLEVRFVGTATPPRDPGWAEETTLDVEWAHAMAPGAKIVLVEAKSAGLDDLMAAIDLANTVIAQYGGGEVSMSWDGDEFDEESAEDAAHFAAPGAVYVAASGDLPGVHHPAILSNVVGVGGTTIVRDPNGQFLGEIPWALEGAGTSTVEHKPAYQSSISQIVGYRGVVDVVAVADFRPGGVWVYYPPGNEATHGWIQVGGTSVATPIIAAIINNSGKFLASSTQELNLIYSEIGSPSFNRIRKGVCGKNGGLPFAETGWTFCGGAGSPAGALGL